MKEFFKENRKTVMSLLLNRFGAIVFALMLSLAIVHVENKIIITLCCILAILFYLYLIYLLMWERGAKDRLKVDGKRLEPCQHKGFMIGVAAAVPSLAVIILGLLFVGIYAVSRVEGILSVAEALRMIAMLLEAMYLPILQIVVPNPATAGAAAIFMSLLLVFNIPGIAITWLSYYLGYHGKLMSRVYKVPKKD